MHFLFKHTHTPQTPTRTALAHSTRTKSTDPVYAFSWHFGGGISKMGELMGVRGPVFGAAQGCLCVGVSRCGPAAVVGRGC